MKKIFKPILLLFILVTMSCSAVTVENPREDLYVSPGSSAKTSFRVINRSNKEQQMSVYQTDYSFTADGVNNFASPGTLPRSNANWLRFTPKQFSIQPGAKITIEVSVSVPNAQLSGSYWSVLMVEYVDSDTNPAENDSKAAVKAAIIVKRRQGIQIRTHVSGTGEMKARYFNQNITKRDGKVLFEVDMENIGTLFYSGKFWVELFDQDGYPVDKVTLSSKSIYPGSSCRFSADITNLKKGKYTALCVYDTQSNKVFGGKYQIKIP